MTSDLTDPILGRIELATVHPHRGAPMASRAYEITFKGEAVPAIVGAFEDFDVTVGTGRTTLRGERLDQPALHGAIDRLQNLGLELLEVRTV
jgi:hypothetical protein